MVVLEERGSIEVAAIGGQTLTERGGRSVRSVGVCPLIAHAAVLVQAPRGLRSVGVCPLIANLRCSRVCPLIPEQRLLARRNHRASQSP